MTADQAPKCGRHETEVSMHLQTIHTDASRPEEVIGQFECPECGYERRQPITVEAA